MNLTTKLEGKKNRIGLVGTRLNFSRPSQGKGIEEHITHDWREIVVKIHRDINLVPDRETQRYIGLVKTHYDTKDPVEMVATDLLYHGCGHRELPTNTGLGCPFTVEVHDQIKDGVARALKEKNKQGLESYLSNAFEDIFDNTNARRHTRHAGQILFWNNEGLESEDQKYPAFYEAFVKLNLLLWGDPADATLLRRFYTTAEKVQKAVSRFKGDLKDYLETDSIVQLYTKDDLFRDLFRNKKHWKELAYRFTLATADLLEASEQMRLCFGIPADEGLPFDKQMKLPQIQEDLAYGRYKAGDGPSQHTDPQLQLDSLYRKISRSIPVKTSAYTKAQGIPIAYFGKRDLGEDETIRIRQIRGIEIDEKGNPTLRMSRHELKHPAYYKFHPRHFPKLKVAIIDTSGSMAQSPDTDNNIGSTTFVPWGDNSKYHYTLKGIYGIDNFLERQGIASYVQSEVVTFSDNTLRSGRGLFRNDAERRALLRKPSGGTKLNPLVIEQTVAEESFLVSISDGEIENWNGVKEKYREAIAKADYVHIHIGVPNAFTQDLVGWGVPVQYVKGDDDLSHLLLDLTMKYYKDGGFK